MEYGFIYIWYDRKHKRYYVGCHWGDINDGYICSSHWMQQAYTRRPEDFKRRILSYIYTNRSDMFQEEMYWHSLIKDHELRTRYYNITRAKNHWTADPIKYKTVGEKISAAPNRKENISKALKGRTLRTEKQKEVLRQAHARQFSDPAQIERVSNFMTEKWKNNDFRIKMSEANKQWHWYNDGTTSKKFKKGSEIPAGFVRGRLAFKKPKI